MTSIKLVGVKKSYKGAPVIHGLDFEVDPGEFIVVVGPSGCGKSSLLRMIAGLESITEGEIYIGDKLVNHLEPKARDIAMVFQNYALYPHMSVFKNMSYGLKMRKVSTEVIQKRVFDAAEMLEISHLLERKPQALSGGQRQRVAMGRAIVRDPNVFLFDEPLSNLDAKLRVGMRLEIKKLQRRLKTTSLYVTHDQTEAMTMADRVLILNQGHIEQFDTPTEVFHRPKTKFVAGFMGANVMNFLEPRLLQSNNFSSEHEIGIRPDDISFGEGDNLNLTIELVETLGDGKLVHGLLDNEEPLTVKCADAHNIKEGERLPIRLNKKKIHLFDKVTGKSVLQELR